MLYTSIANMILLKAKLEANNFGNIIVEIESRVTLTFT